MTLPTPFHRHDDIPSADALDARARRYARELTEAERETRVALLRLELAKIRLKRLLDEGR